MKPTRICNWPPRLDVALRAQVRIALVPRRRRLRPGRAVHPSLRAAVRWAGRPAKQRRFEASKVQVYPA